MAKKKKPAEPRIVRPDDVDPTHHWDRPLPAPGHTQVDFEERVNFRRLHDYRLARTRAALAHSGLGALLCFDQHNIRYTTSTVIGEWARDKLTRYSLLTGNGDPYVWDFGSAAAHHRLHAPWLHHDHCRAGLLGLRGATVGGAQRAGQSDSHKTVFDVHVRHLRFFDGLFREGLFGGVRLCSSLGVLAKFGFREWIDFTLRVCRGLCAPGGRRRVGFLLDGASREDHDEQFIIHRSEILTHQRQWRLEFRR